jgi:methyl-accepting chemotaxis protein
MLLLTVYIFTILLSTPVIYIITKQEVYSQAEENLDLLVDVVKSVRNYVSKDLRPHFLEQEIYYSPAISGIVAISKISKYLKQKQPQYYISNVSDNLLNPDNQAKGLEQDLLEYFRKIRTKKTINTTGEINGQNYLVSSAPMVSKDLCLRCHGDPVGAPEDVRANYDLESGFGYTIDEVVGVSVVGVPLKDVQSLAMIRSLIVIGAITLLFTALFLIVNLLVKRFILEPISEITTMAVAVSHGDISREVNVNDQKDEIAELAFSFELMRRSLVAAMKRIKRKPP